MTSGCIGRPGGMALEGNPMVVYEAYPCLSTHRGLRNIFLPEKPY